MKIDSFKNFFGAGSGVVLFTGTGSVDGADTSVIDHINFDEKFQVIISEDYSAVMMKNSVKEVSFAVSSIENQETWLVSAEGHDAIIGTFAGWRSAGTGPTVQPVSISGSIPAYDPNLYPLPWGGFITSYTDETKTIVSYIQFYTVVNGFFGEGVFAWVYDYSASDSTSMKVILGEY